MKANEEFIELWTDFLEGELDANGMKRLRELLAENEDLRSVAGELYQTHRLIGLAREMNGKSIDAFIDNTLNRLPADGDAFADNVVSMLPNNGGGGRRFRGRRPWFALAAAIALRVSTKLRPRARPASIRTSSRLGADPASM